MFSHLQIENLSYSSHFIRAFNLSWTCLKASYFLFVHAVYPDMYAYEGSKLIEKMYIECKNK